MYAVVKTGGKQYRVAKDDVILVERIEGEPGASVSLDEVLMVGDGAAATLGSPLVDGASVAATVLDQTRGPKILVFRKKRRKNFRRLKGHRQDLTALRITDILADGAKTPAPRRASRARKRDDVPASDEAEAAAGGAATAGAAEAAASDTPAASDAAPPGEAGGETETS